MWVLCMSTCWLQGGSATLKEVLGPCYGQLSSIDLDTAPEVVAVGPRQASQMLALSLNEEKEREKWLEQARVQARAWSRHWMLGTGVRLSVQAIAGSCPRSRDSVVSGLRCWFEFARCILKLPASRALPPTRKGLLAWSNLFRHQRTFANYLSYVRFGCELTEVSTEVFDDPVLRRAKTAIQKRGAFTTRPRMFLRSAVSWAHRPVPLGRVGGGMSDCACVQAVSVETDGADGEGMARVCRLPQVVPVHLHVPPAFAIGMSPLGGGAYHREVPSGDRD